MPKVLVVDDSETQRFELKSELEGAGFQVTEAVDGADGLKKLESEGHEVVLVICDVNMPVMDGLTMCAMIQASGRQPLPPIFMLTTEASPELKLEGKKVGVRLWITKPFSPIKLIEAAKKVTGIN